RPGFIYKKNQLHCELVPLQRLAEQYGTPLYVYSASAIRDRYRVLDRAFAKTSHTISYSVKANSNLSILRMLARLGAGFDIVSSGEVGRGRIGAQSAGAKVVLSGVGKAEAELVAGFRGGILLLNLESEGELELLARCAKKLRKQARLAFRVNPDVS